MAKELKGSKTHDNLKAAFAGESQANRRYLYFAKVADVEGYPEIAANFRDTAEGETGHAHGHLDYIKKVGDPATVTQIAFPATIDVRFSMECWSIIQRWPHNCGEHSTQCCRPIYRGDKMKFRDQVFQHGQCRMCIFQCSHRDHKLARIEYAEPV